MGLVRSRWWWDFMIFGLLQPKECYVSMPCFVWVVSCVKILLELFLGVNCGSNFFLSFFPQGIVGNLASGKSALVHRYLTGTYVQEESPEGMWICKSLCFFFFQTASLFIFNHAEMNQLRIQFAFFNVHGEFSFIVLQTEISTWNKLILSFS